MMHHGGRHHHGPPPGASGAAGAGERPGAPREPEPAYEFLDPERISLVRDYSGRLRLIVKDDRCYLDVKVVRTFPHSEPERYFGLLNAAAGDAVIGIVVESAHMDPQSAREAAGALHGHYFIPTITRILSLKEEFGAFYFDVETDRGPRHFVARGIRDAIEDLGEGELLLPDVDGNRYRVANWRLLDARSRRLLERVI